MLLDKAEDTVSALELLTALEGVGEDEYEEALALLEERGILPDISDLPKPAMGGEAALRLRQEEQLAAKGLHPSALEEGDPLRLYLEEVAMTPAFGDQQLLAEEVLSGSERAMEQLTNLSLSRVIELARGYVGRGVLLMDLIQEGSLGLWQAIQNYTGGDFAAYRDGCIHMYLSRAVLTQARESGVGQKLRTALEDYRSVDERLLSELGRNPTVEEIAEAMHMTPESAATIAKMVENARLLQSAKREPDPEEEPPWFSEGDPPEEDDIMPIEDEDPDEPGAGGGFAMSGYGLGPGFFLVCVDYERILREGERKQKGEHFDDLFGYHFFVSSI